MIDTLCMIAIVAIMAALYLMQRRDIARERKAWDEERGDMMDRLMARDYGEYTRVKDKTPLPGVISKHEQVLQRWREKPITDEEEKQ